MFVHLAIVYTDMISSLIVIQSLLYKTSSCPSFSPAGTHGWPASLDIEGAGYKTKPHPLQLGRGLQAVANAIKRTWKVTNIFF